jgi:DNA-binding GntR family transcriptional regulator
MVSVDSKRKVARRTVAEQAYDNVRNMILMGELPPNSRITHDELAAVLGVSTMPVREALLRLSHEGLVDISQTRSFTVAPATRSDIQDIYWLQGTLSGELTARACRNSGQNLADQLRSVQERWEHLPKTATPEALDKLNHEFHRAINKAGESPKLLVLLENTLRFIPDHFYSLLPAWSEMSLKGHQAIIEAIDAGDAKAARRAAQHHVEEAGALLIEHFDELGFWTVPG